MKNAFRLFLGVVVISYIGIISRDYLATEGKQVSIGNYGIFSPNGEQLIITQGGINGRNLYPEITVLDSTHFEKKAEIAKGGYNTLAGNFSFDGVYFVTRIASNSVRVWTTHNWELIGEISFKGLACDLDNHPTEEFIAIASCGPRENGIYIANISTQSIFEVIVHYSDALTSQVSYNFTGNIIAYSHTTNLHETQISILNLSSKTSQEYHIDTLVTDLQWSPTDNILLISTEDGNLIEWEKSRNELETIIAINEEIKNMAFSPNGNYVAIGSTGKLIIFKSRTWEQWRVFDVEGISSVNFNTIGNFVVAVHPKYNSESVISIFNIEIE